MHEEIADYMRKHLDLLLQQTKAYGPFIKTAFPGMNLSEACFNLMVGNAFSVFLGQYAMRMISPTEQDFAEFGQIVIEYREKIVKMFSS